jgi:hypothetical protein
MNAAMLFGGLTGMDPASASLNAKQLQLQQLMSSNIDLGSNLLAHHHQQQQHMGMFSAGNSLGFPQHSARRDLLAHAPSMMGLPGGSNPAFMEPSMALGEAFDLLQNLQPTSNQTSQLFGSLQQHQQKRENYFKDLFGVFATGSQPDLQVQQQPQEQVSAVSAAAAISQSAASSMAQGPPQKKKRRRKNGDGDLESLPDDISGIFD